MGEWSLYEYSLLAQVIMGLGVIVSLYLSSRAVQEVQKDREIGARPHLMFQPRGTRVPIVFQEAGSAIPGINPSVAKKFFDHIPDDAESVRPGRIGDNKNGDGSRRPVFYGHLRNYGRGPALDTHVTWHPEKIWVGSEQFRLDERKQSEPSYRPDLNRMPTVPGHIESGDQAKLSRIPTFIDKDYEKKINIVTGLLEISCQDVFGNEHSTCQEFRIFTEYDAEDPYLVVTFGEMREGEEALNRAKPAGSSIVSRIRGLLAPEWR